jgi:glyoxylase-like metal-dependent hydrolase (beta-lactamase superfamily II)
MKMHVLDLGTLKADRNLLVLKSAFASRSNPAPPCDFHEFPVSAYLVEHARGRVLFDTGCHPEAMGSGGRWPPQFQDEVPFSGGAACCLPQRLQDLGLGPDDIDDVVLSHMHNDHAGCVEFFGRSRLLVHEDEFAACLRAYALGRKMDSYIWDDTHQWVGRSLNWRLVGRDEPDFELAEGVRLLNLGPGHSYGMLGLHVTLPETGHVLLVSDAVYTSDNYGPPERYPGVVYDTIGWQRTVTRIRRLAADLGAQVWFGHDAKQFATLIKAPAGVYR